MKIVVFNPKESFTLVQQKQIASFGKVVYAKDRNELSVSKLLEMAKGADIIMTDTDPLGGFEKAKEKLTQVIKSLPNLKGICLSTTSVGWVDLNLCKERGVIVSNISGHLSESVGETTLALLLGLAKRIFISDRRYQKGKYFLDQGFELKGKTLGIIGLGSIGKRVAELGRGIGMNVIAYNRSNKTMKGVKMVTLDQLLKQSDAISLHVTDEKENMNMIGVKEIKRMKTGVIIVNTADRGLVDESEMAKALKSGKVDSYGYEAEDLIHTPLAYAENAIGLQGFAWFTKEALEKLHSIWVSNLTALAKGKPQNRVV